MMQENYLKFFKKLDFLILVEFWDLLSQWQGKTDASLSFLKSCKGLPMRSFFVALVVASYTKYNSGFSRLQID